ncbi:MAG: phosphomannomutase/phosphoglucomutase [Fretibacterium sp.]|nr:phosphomannomutase/phosphoglucomutase [Fretibacterium sp.]
MSGLKVLADIFREYDIRGDADQELTDNAVEAIGRAYGTWLRRKGVSRASIGGDVRLSTERIRAAVTRGLLATGIDVIDIGVVTTPLLYWSLRRLELKGGVMITGSHNPPNMNGLKLCWDKGTLWGDEVQAIRRLIEADDFDGQTAGLTRTDKLAAFGRSAMAEQGPGGLAEAEGTGTLTRQDLSGAYLEMLASKFQAFNRKFKVVCDSGNGTAGPLARRFFTSLGCECVPLFEEPDGRFPNHHPDPQKRENLQALIAKVREVGADVGFAFDGDADRIGVVDERGEVVFGDRLMALYWRDILKSHPGAEAIIEPKCSMALAEEVEKCGGRPLYWKSGHSVIKAKMREINALFAGEYSGHMFFADEYYGFDDPFYAAGRLLRILSNEGKTLSEIMSSIPLYPITEEARIPCPDTQKFDVVARIRDAALKDHEGITLDGIRILYKDGWGLIRASNTQPVITVRCEGRDQESLTRVMADVKARVLAEGLPDFTWTF